MSAAIATESPPNKILTPLEKKKRNKKQKRVEKKEQKRIEEEKPAIEKEEPTIEKEEPAIEKEEPTIEKEEPAIEKEEKAAPVRKYWPIEFFLLEDIKEMDLSTWIVDQVNILRAVFEIGRWRIGDETLTETLTVNGHEINLRLGDSSFFVGCKKATNTEILRDKERKVRSVCIHLTDGTAAILLRRQDRLTGYHFCFEESADWSVLSGSQ